MKKDFEIPTLETYEFIVAARLSGSGFHSYSANTPECMKPITPVSQNLHAYGTPCTI